MDNPTLDCAFRPIAIEPELSLAWSGLLLPSATALNVLITLALLPIAMDSIPEALLA